MEPLAVIALLAALVAACTVVGLVLRARSGRVRAVSGDQRDARLAVPGAEVTVLQLSSPVCSACAVMRRVTEEIAADTDGVARRELDVTEHPDLAAAHNVLSTPTTLLIDATGVVRSRIIGAAKPADVRAAIDAVRVPA